MAYADELLELAKQLAAVESKDLQQAYYRRAVSTAYYALFHLLISEATANWKFAEQRAELGRLFEHGKMKDAAQQIRASQSDPAASVLLDIAKTFVRLQQNRQEADYNVAKEWDQADVETQIKAAAEAFESWRAISAEPRAQAFLVSMLGRRLRPA